MTDDCASGLHDYCVPCECSCHMPEARPLEALIAEMLKVWHWRAVDWPSPDFAQAADELAALSEGKEPRMKLKTRCTKCSTPQRDPDQDHPGICICGGYLEDVPIGEEQVNLPEQPKDIDFDSPALYREALAAWQRVCLAIIAATRPAVEPTHD